MDLDGPSPAKYNYLKPFGFDAPKFSMKGRHNTPPKLKKDNVEDDSEKKEEKPYLPQVTIQIRNTGKYIVSQIPNVNSLKFDKDKSKRSQFVANKNPGPAYKIPSLICNKIIESKYRNYERITMSKRNQIKDSRSNYPGPGSYPLPSDFGQYESKDADKYPKENVYVEERPKFEEKAWRHNMKIPKPKEEIPEENYDENPDDNGGETPDNDEVTPGQKEDEKTEVKKKETPKKEETPKEETPKEETPKEEEDTKSELMLLKDILVYKEGEAQEFEEITPNKANEEDKKETPKEETPKEEPKKEETPKGETPKEETPKEEPKKEETPKEETPKEETPKEEPKKEETPKGEEDKESEAIMLKDILTYREGES